MPLKQIAAKHFGSDFAYRKKQSLWVPYDMYLQTPEALKYIKQTLLPSVKSRGAFRYRLVKRAYKDIARPANCAIVWQSLLAELWLKRFVDGDQ